MRHSVIITVYNKAPYVGRAIASLANQSRPPAELIIVDDCSTDGSVQAVQQSLQQYSAQLTNTNVKLIQLQQNGGPSLARNVGLDAVTGDWVSLLDGDDEYAPGFCDRVQSIVQNHQPDLLVLSFINLPSKLIRPVIDPIKHLLNPIDDRLYALADPLKVITWQEFPLGPGNNVLCRRSLIGELRYNTQNDLFENIEFWYQVVKNSVENGSARCFLLLGEFLQIHEVGNSISRRKLTDINKIKWPALLDSLLDSQSEFDRRLWHKVATRWFNNILDRLDTPSDRLRFLWQFRRFAFRYYLRPVDVKKVPD
ncbi:MAG TPA: glycosyltransferase family 2 protein [Leptolyngbyaceae cyanobacterium]